MTLPQSLRCTAQILLRNHRLYTMATPALIRQLSVRTSQVSSILRQRSYLNPIKTSYSALHTASSPQAAVASLKLEPEPETPTEYVPVPFSSISSISPKLQKALANVFGYETMSKVQHAVLSRMPLDADLLVKAKTGTGKTLAFLVPAIEEAIKTTPKERRNKVSVFIISPTRELAQQIASEAEKLVTFHRLKVHCLVGGEKRYHQVRGLLSKPVDIVVGTPGRLKDLLESEKEFKRQCDGVKVVVLDEADRLLDMGFRDEIESILEYLPSNRRSLLFSATVAPEIRQIAATTLRPDHVYIDTVDPNDVNTNLQVKQTYSVIPLEQQPLVVHQLLNQHREQCPRENKAIVFLPTTRSTELYAQVFRNILPQFKVFELHSRMDQRRRTKIADNYRRARGNAVLFTSDVSARGVDYPGVTMVLQVGIPSSRETYIHRLGRTGRAGKEGEGKLLIAPFERRFVEDELNDLPIEKVNADINTEVEETQLVRAELERVIQNTDEELLQSACHGFLGYYAGQLGTLGFPRHKLLRYLDEYAKGFGCEETPYVPAMLVEKLGLKERKPRSEFNGRSSLRNSNRFRSHGDGRFPRFDGRNRGQKKYATRGQDANLF
ncbi:uncharacterized protein VTP21DRAFT_4629 [Calcarisporiella thermophila]|uniref:uncharacterized protein n=1 Tax=Calcarisporiella thermophila TaxID=911321 RepID=UPI00374320BE